MAREALPALADAAQLSADHTPGGSGILLFVG
jgi:hypothetical protein